MYTIPPRKRKPHIYKTTYLSETLAEKIEEVAAKNNTSFNFALVYILESVLFPEQTDKENQNGA